LLHISIDTKGFGFIAKIQTASQKGVEEFGIMMLCVHAAADAATLENTYNYKINPAIQSLQNLNDYDFCKIIVAVIPIQETEAWMLADKVLLKTKIGTNMTDTDLGMNRQPEDIARPKEEIENAIRLAMQNATRRKRRNFSIADLYLPIGQEIELSKLENLTSFRDFKQNVKSAFRTLFHTE